MRKQLLLLFLLLLAAPVAEAQTINFTMEEYPPYTYREGEKVIGSSIDQLEFLMKNSNVDYKIRIMPWARAYADAQNLPDTCAVTTARIPAREKLFKWVSPILTDKNILIKRKGSAVKATSIQEATAYIAGTWRNDYGETLLREAKFEKIDISTDFAATMKKLLNNRIEVMPISESYFDKLLKEGAEIEKIGVLSNQSFGIACNHAVPDDLLTKMQSNLDHLIANGTQKAIFKKYGLDVLE